ncbi:MAG: hypothetical protein F6K36_31180 [Symploca sp. SIO3C6]|nr:hypothetical protein [Symploca sp. SIO3C6]
MGTHFQYEISFSLAFSIHDTQFGIEPRSRQIAQRCNCNIDHDRHGKKTVEAMHQ